MFSSHSLAASSMNFSEDLKSQNTVSRLVVIDTAVADYQQLVSGVVADAAVLLLDPQQDGVTQITSALRQQPGITQLHLIAHGSPGALYLGQGELSLSTLSHHRSALAEWFGDSGLGAGANGELLLYGCNVAAGDAGEEFVGKLQAITGAKVAASSTAVGSPSQGGNWSLDRTTADFTPELALSTALQACYAGTFDWFQAELLLADSTNGVTENPDTSEGDIDNGDQFGTSVAIFGEFAFVGVPNNTDVVNNGAVVPGDDVGSVYVFRVDPSTGRWTRETQLNADDATANAFFGQAVDASTVEGSDNLFLAVGAPGARTPVEGGNPNATETTGAVYVFERNAITGEWSQTQKLIHSEDDPPSGVNSSRAGDRFGESVGIDGQTIVVGSPNDNPNGLGARAGSIYLFEAPVGTTTWQQTVKIPNPTEAPENAAIDDFGAAVAIADGLIIAGAPNASVPDESGQQVTGGAAYIFRQINGAWDTGNPARLTANDVGSILGEQDAHNGDRFGASVDITNGYAIVGSPGNDLVVGDVGNSTTFANAGSAYIYRDINGAWIQTQQLTGSDNTLRSLDEFGFSVAIDAGAAVVGSIAEEENFDDPTFVNEIAPTGDPAQNPAPRLPSPGVAYIYEFSEDGTLLDLVDRTTSDDRIDGDQFGAAVDVFTSEAGASNAIVGASARNFVRDNNDFAVPTPPGGDGRDDIVQAGAAYIFRAQPQLTAAIPNVLFVNDPLIAGTNPTAPGVNQLEIQLVFDQPMNQTIAPTVTFPNPAENPLSTLTLAANSQWVAPNTFIARYDLTDVNIELINIDIAVDGGVGINGALQLPAIPPANALVTDIFSIDTLNPTITVFEAFVDNGAGPVVAPLFVNQPFAVFGGFSEPVDPATFTLDSLAIAGGSIEGLVLSPNGQSFSYTVNPAVEGSVFVDIPTIGEAGVLLPPADLRGNPSTPVTFIERIYDITPPEVTLEVLDPNNPAQLLAGPTNQPFTVRARFSEPVVGFELADVTLSNGAVASNFIEVSNDDTSGSEYRFTVDPTSLGGIDAPVSVNVAAGTLTDRATNLNGASAPLTVAYDGLRPVVTGFAVQAGSLNVDGEVEGVFLVDVVFSEAVTGLEVADIAIQNGTVQAVTAISPTQFVLTVEPIAEAAVVLSLPENIVTDLAQNQNQASAPLTVFFRPPAPNVVSITPSVATVTDSDAGQELVFTIVWSTDMDTSVEDIPIIGFTAAENPVGSLIDDVPIDRRGVWIDSRTFERRFRIVDTNVDLSDIDLLVSEGLDIEGNLQSPNPAIIEDVFSVSTVNPSLTLSADTTTSPFVVTALFSEDVTGFDLTDINTTNANASGLVAVSASEYQFTLTPNNSTEPVSLTINDGAAADVGGNLSTTASLALDDINDPPVVLAPDNIAPLPGSRSMVFSSSTGNAIVVSDPDAAVNSQIRLELTANQGLISLSGLTGLTLTEGDGTGDGRIVLTGTLSDINAALEGARFKPFNTTGNASLQIDVNDLGNTGGNAIPQSTSETIDIPVSFNGEQDFNGDGFEDILWTQNTGSGVQVVAWSLEETSPDSYTRTNVAIDPNGLVLPNEWEAVGTFDFNNDGNVDILWRRPSTFQNVIWFMDGDERQSNAFFAPSNPVDANQISRWRMEDVADLDGDDQAEVIWRDTASGQVVIWNTNGLDFDSSLFVDLTGIGQSADGLLPLQWEFGATGDFNGDGRDDILWRNTLDGSNVVWLLDGNELLESRFIEPNRNLNFDIVGAGDYNGDGNTDILWRQGSRNEIWELDANINSISRVRIDNLNSRWLGIS